MVDRNLTGQERRRFLRGEHAGVDVERTVGLVRSLDGRPTVLCGHGREIEALIDSLEHGGATVEGKRGLAKGSVWVLDRVDGRVVAARYLPAP